jgi:hypothetical protein
MVLRYIVSLDTQSMDSLSLNFATDYHVTYISFVGCLFYLIVCPYSQVLSKAVSSLYKLHSNFVQVALCYMVLLLFA